MHPHDLSAGGDVRDRVTRCARQAAGGYGCHPAATITLLNVSENATYLVGILDQVGGVLRHVEQRDGGGGVAAVTAGGLTGAPGDAVEDVTAGRQVMRMHRVPRSCSRLPRARSTTPPPATFTHSAVRGCCHQRWAAPTTSSRARTARRSSSRSSPPSSSSSCSPCSPAATTRRRRPTCSSTG